MHAFNTQIVNTVASIYLQEYFMDTQGVGALKRLRNTAFAVHHLVILVSDLSFREPICAGTRSRNVEVNDNKNTAGNWLD